MRSSTQKQLDRMNFLTVCLFYLLIAGALAALMSFFMGDE